MVGRPFLTASAVNVFLLVKVAAQLVLFLTLQSLVKVSDPTA